MKYVGYPDGLGVTIEDMRKWLVMNNANLDRHHYVVYAPEIGFCGEVYYKVEAQYRRTELDIKFLPEAQGLGLASDAFDTLLHIVFDSEPEVDAVYTSPNNENAASRRLYIRYGFKIKPWPPGIETSDVCSYMELARKDFVS